MLIEPLAQQHHQQCIICGQHNASSWGLKFTTDQQGITSTRFQSNETFQGYNNCIHGGIITTLLDATMTHCLFSRAIVAMTAKLQVRFLHPVPCDALLQITAQIIKSNKNLYLLHAELLYNKQCMAWADASFVRLKEHT